MSKRTIYIAAPWVNKAEAREAQARLRAAGHVTVSHWIDYHSDATLDEEHAEELTRQAMEDLKDLRAADTFVIMNLGKSEGKATELGYVLGLAEASISSAFEYDEPKEIFLVGDRSINIFYFLPEVNQVANLDELIERLG